MILPRGTMFSRASLLLLIFATSCSLYKTGPCSLQRDSLLYNYALHDTLSSQLLLNIVRLHYRESPTFLQVGIISSAYENGYSLGSGMEFKWTRPDTASALFAPRIGLDVKEKPTTTFQHLRGEEFVKEFLSPISIKSLVLLNSSGWKIDHLLRCCVQRIRHIKNAPDLHCGGETDEIEFITLCNTLAALDRQDAVTLTLQYNIAEKSDELHLIFDRDLADPSTLRKIKDMLRLDLESDDFRLVACRGRLECASSDITIEMRSPLSLFHFLSRGVETPLEDQMKGLIPTGLEDVRKRAAWSRLLDGIFTLRSGTPPKGTTPAAAVWRGGQLFYIDERDLATKSTFVLLSQILALQINMPEIPAPVITLPLNN